VLLGFSSYAGAELGFESELERKLFGTASLVALALISASGLKLSAWVWNSITVLKLLPLVLLIGLSAWLLVPAPAPAPAPRPISPGELWRGRALARSSARDLRVPGLRDRLGARGARAQPRCHRRGDGRVAGGGSAALPALARGGSSRGATRRWCRPAPRTAGRASGG
jgi:hypothetical protein